MVTFDTKLYKSSSCEKQKEMNNKQNRRGSDLYCLWDKNLTSQYLSHLFRIRSCFRALKDRKTFTKDAVRSLEVWLVFHFYANQRFIITYYISVFDILFIIISFWMYLLSYYYFVNCNTWSNASFPDKSHRYKDVIQLVRLIFCFNIWLDP